MEGCARVTTVTIGDKLHQEWAVAFDNPVASELDGMLGCDDVHTVDLCVRHYVNGMVLQVKETDLDTGDLIATGKVLGVGRTPLGGSTHTILVVLADKYAWEVPQFRLSAHIWSVCHCKGVAREFTGHVECLKDLALVTRTITVEGKRGCLVAEVFLSKSETSTDGDLGTDDTVSTKEGRGEDVHRTAFSVGHAGLTTE